MNDSESLANLKVFESESPIDKDRISRDVLEFLYSKAGDNIDVLRASYFSLEFIATDGINAFIKFKLFPSKDEIEFKLEGESLNSFIEILKRSENTGQ